MKSHIFEIPGKTYQAIRSNGVQSDIFSELCGSAHPWVFCLHKIQSLVFSSLNVISLSKETVLAILNSKGRNSLYLSA